MSIPDNIAKIKKRFNFFNNDMDKYEHIIELSKKSKGLEDSEKTREHEIIGCQSRSWMVPQIQDGGYSFRTDSEAFIVKGLLYVLEQIFNGNTKEDILKTDEDSILESIGLGGSISTQRQLGFRSAIKKMKEYCEKGDWTKTR